MSIDIRLPNITAGTDSEKLKQLHSYMYQLVEQLNWALNNIDTAGISGTENPAVAKPTASNKQDDPVSNFNSIKGLIIKSADIVNAYYDKIDELLKLSGEYIASSDFGTFKEQTLNQLSATNDQIQQNVTSFQQIFDENGNIRKEILVNGNIYSGIIGYAMNDDAIVGIEIGQTTTRKDNDGNSTEIFSAFARFTADRLSFYDFNGTEVAYISDYKLYITHVQITDSLTIGGYVDTVVDGGIVTKWVGYTEPVGGV